MAHWTEVTVPPGDGCISFPPLDPSFKSVQDFFFKAILSPLIPFF